MASLFAVTVLSTLTLCNHAYADDDDDDDDDDAAVEEVATEYTEEEWRTVEKPRIDGIYNAERNRLYALYESQITLPRTVEYIKLNIRKRLNAPKMGGNFAMLRLPGIEINWNDYNSAPTKSKDAVVAEVEERGRQLAEKEVQPEARKARVLEDAEELYTMYKIGERVTLTLRGGRGANTIIEDKPFMALNEEVVQLGQRLIIRSDLDDLDQAKFYSDLNETAKADYIRNEQGKIQVEYDTMVEDYCIRNTPVMLREAGYVPNINEKFASLRTSKTQYWIPKRDMVANVRKKLIEIAQERVRKVEMPEFMRKQGFILYPALDGKGRGLDGSDTEWISEKEKARREAPPPAADPNDGMYGDPAMMMGPPPGMR